MHILMQLLMHLLKHLYFTSTYFLSKCQYTTQNFYIIKHKIKNQPPGAGYNFSYHLFLNLFCP